LLGLLCGCFRKTISERLEDCEVEIMALITRTTNTETKVSADSDTVETAILEGVVVPQAPEAHQLEHAAAEWLALYASDDNIEIAQSVRARDCLLGTTANPKRIARSWLKPKGDMPSNTESKFPVVRVKKN
jgi:hypothetical protein